jgi:uncharacterized protein involved in cysteine biosynthesis
MVASDRGTDVGNAVLAIVQALRDVIFGRLTLLALINLVLAGAITGGAAVSLMRYLIPLIPEGQGWLGVAFDASEVALSVGAAVLAIALSPAVSMVIGGTLFDFAAERVEKAIGAPVARKISILEGLGNGLRIALPALLLNLLVSPLYLVPGLNVIVFYALNGYLMGREYSTLAAARRMPFDEAKRLRKRARLSVFLTGLACSVIPFVAPLVAASAMTRLVDGVLRTQARRRARSA